MFLLGLGVLIAATVHAKTPLDVATCETSLIQLELPLEKTPPPAPNRRRVTALLAEIFPNFGAAEMDALDRAMTDLITEDLDRLGGDDAAAYLRGLRATRAVDGLPVLGVYWPEDRLINLRLSALRSRLARLVFTHERRHLLDHIIKPRLFERFTIHPFRTLRLEWRAQRDVFRLVGRSFERPALVAEWHGSQTRLSILRQYAGVRPAIDIAPADVISAQTPVEKKRRIADELSFESGWNQHLSEQLLFRSTFGTAKFLIAYKGSAWRDLANPTRAFGRVRDAFKRYRRGDPQGRFRF